MLQTWQYRLVHAGFLAVAAGVFATLPNRMVGFRPLIWLISSAVLMGFCYWASRRAPLRLPEWAARNASRIMTAALAFGVMLRVLFPLIVPPTQVSDGSEYLSLARGLLTKGVYEWIMPNGNHWYAWRPPGTAAAIAAFITVFGDTAWLPAFINISMYVITSLILRRLAIEFVSPAAAMVSQILYATWISNIAASGMYQSESFFLVTVYLSIWLFLRAGSAASLFLTGLVTGLSILVRQALLPVPVFWLLRRPSPRVLAAVAGMVLTVAPWAIRNRSLGVPVTVSSNTGSILYMVTGEFDPTQYEEGMVKEMFVKVDYDEYRQHTEMGRLAVEWIMANPVRWTELVIRRVPLFLGEDSGGLYFAMRLARRYEGAAYAIPQLMSQAWWALIWVLAAIAAFSRRREIGASLDIQFMLWIVLLFVVTALPFHMQPRYHTGLVPTVLLMSGWAFSSGGERKPAS